MFSLKQIFQKFDLSIFYPQVINEFYCLNLNLQLQRDNENFLNIRIQNQIKKNQNIQSKNSQQPTSYFSGILQQLAKKLQKMSSNKLQIVYMIGKLQDWGKELGNSDSRRKLAGSQFDAWQQEFLIKRYQTEKLQNQKEAQGLNTKTASHGFKIRQGITEMQTAIGKMQQQNRKLAKKKDVAPEHNQRRQKIIQNCQRLLQDIRERQQAANDPNGYNKPTKILTLTDMRAKLLTDIEEQNYQIHQINQGSEDQLGDDQRLEQEREMQKMKQKNKEIDNALDGIIDGIVGLTGKVKGINKKQDQVIQATKKNSKEVTKVSNRIETDNDKLKKIIKQFGPSRCCLSITLLLLFVGLIVVVIKMFVLG